MKPASFQELHEQVITLLGAPDDAQPLEEQPITTLLTANAWRQGGFGKLWRMKAEGFVFTSAGVLSAHGERTLGCVRYEQPSKPNVAARSVFLLLAQTTDGPHLAGIYSDVPSALAWLRGWIDAGLRIQSLAADPRATALAQTMLAAWDSDTPEARAASLTSLIVIPDAERERLLAGFDKVAPVVLGVHSLDVIGRSYIGLGASGGEQRDFSSDLWLIIEWNHESSLPRLIHITSSPVLDTFLVGAHRAQAAPADAVSDIFIERLVATANASANAAASDKQARFRQELISRLTAAFSGAPVSDQAALAAVRDVLDDEKALREAKSFGEVLSLLLERLKTPSLN